MLDHRARPVAQRLLAPIATALPISANALTVIGLLIGLLAAIAAGATLWPVALVLWLLNRLLDGLDGFVARGRGQQSDFGGYLDILADVTIYAALPLGIAVGLDERSAWIAAAVLLATFYMNATSWLFLSALQEKRLQGATASGETTSVTMPTGLIEGTETILFFALMLVVPSLAVWLMWIMAAGVLLTVIARLIASAGLLEPLETVPPDTSPLETPAPETGATSS